MAKSSDSPEDVIKFFADAPASVYELAKQTNPLLQKCIKMAGSCFKRGVRNEITS
ncbi:MAG: hypothetical protein OI715_01040 (plasmid) [Candidatus Methanoperedens sp.]|nr:MAG: hypothetical protein OI715_01040 [Candidatus Methanoperedens sp.]